MCPLVSILVGAACLPVLLMATQDTLEITSPVDGDILNRHDGTELKDRLEITVRGRASAAQVKVNGRSVPVRDGAFEAPLSLTARETRIVAEGGAARQTITVLWDRNSRRRYRFSIDDNILFLKDIAEHKDAYGSIFDNPYLAFFRQMHQRYGAKIHFNIYYETPGFNLSQMPAKYRSEWQANAGWMHLSFHARANDPDRPYISAPASQVLADYQLVMKEIERFAGKEVISPVTTIHWGEATRESCAALRQAGVRTLVGYFDYDEAGKPLVSYYLGPDQLRHFTGRDYWKDTSLDLLFVRHDIVLNIGPTAEILPKLDRIAADPHRSEVIELMIHEQYFYPDYHNYLADYRDRVERAIRWATQKGYAPVFYGEGFLGSPE